MKKTLSLLAGSAALFTTAAGAQCPPAELSPSSAANGTVTQPYTTVNFTSSAPGTFTFSGEDLPAGLTLSPAGALSGTPTAAGTSLSRIIATDTAGCVVTRTLPITIGLNCLTLGVGQVQLFDGAAASDFCVFSDAIDSEYTLIPVSTAGDASTLSVSTLGVDIGAVTGPPTPIAPDSLLDPLASDRAEEAHAPRAADLPVFESLEQRAQALIPPAPHGTVAPAVDQIIDIQVAPGCTGATDIRKGRVEAISPVSTPAKPRLYMVQEVIEQPPAGSGIWVPAVPGGFARQDFEVFRDAFDGLPPGITGPGSSTLGTLAMTGGRDAQIDNFGTVTDLDANGGVIVFFTKAMNELSPPASSSVVPAVFDSRDLYAAASCPRSNEGEYIYMLVPDPTGSVNSNVRTLSFVFGGAVRNLMHHYTHLVNASRRLYVNSAPLEETWLDEGLAWIAEEMLFFNTSVGLAPRGNITLTDLTSGPNASRRVAAFNTYANPRFGGHRSFYLQNPTTSPLGGIRVGPLRRTPFAVPASNDHESRYLQDSVMGVFLRYAADRLGGSDAAFFTALTNATTTGVVNLQARLGADPNLWARDMAIASYTDDAVAGTAPEYTFPSWNYRSVFGGLGGFPMAVQPLTNNSAYTAGYGAGGGPRWLRFGIPAAQTNPGNFTLRESGTNPMPATSLTALVRTK